MCGFKINLLLPKMSENMDDVDEAIPLISLLNVEKKLPLFCVASVLFGAGDWL